MDVTRQSATALLEGSRLVSRSFLSLGLPQRLVLFALLFAAEWSPISNLVHKDRGAGSLLHLSIVFASFFLALGYLKERSLFRRISNEIAGIPIGWHYLGLHLVAFIGFIGLSYFPQEGDSSGIQAYLVASTWYVAGILAIAFAGFAFVPPKPALRLVRGAGSLWIYALAVATIAHQLVSAFPRWNGLVWKTATDLTFSLVKAFLQLFLSKVIADPAVMTIGNPDFSITILPWCSGFEGAALMLVFSVAWLCFFRREFRFPQALLLIPLGMLTIWLSNAVRITVLILIGVAGLPGIAMGGFHSQAGWIAFNCVALGFVIVAQRVRWFSARPSRSGLQDGFFHNPTAAYLTPFLMILAAAMISRAASEGFEWLYPLRLVAAGAALWIFRSSYKDLDWRFGWISPLIGSLVFVIWVVLDKLAGAPSAGVIGTGLAAMPAATKITWLALRTAGAVITVPIAEELAFRGFLIRRLISADFESHGLRKYTYLSVLISSVAFGLMHGDRWLAGTVAGVLYAITLLTRGRIGDAIVAHATTNALLAAWVLYSGNWNLW